jgi:copper chaperone
VVERCSLLVAGCRLLVGLRCPGAESAGGNERRPAGNSKRHPQLADDNPALVPYPVVMPTTTLLIDGMSCDHCVQSISAALEQLPGVEKAEVSLERHEAVVEHASGTPPLEAMVKAVEDEGYGASRP